MSDPSWWKKTLKSIHPLRHGDVVDTGYVMATNEDMKKQACHPFYGMMVGEDGHMDEVGGRLSRNTDVVSKVKLRLLYCHPPN